MSQVRASMVAMRAGAGLRLTRAVVFAAVCAAVSAAGHVMIGHTTLTPAALAAGFGLALGLGFALAGRERGLPVILGAMLAGEAGLHAVFGALAPGMAAPVAVPADPAMAGQMAGHPMAAHGGAGMVFAHAWAGLLASWWLHRGERALWSLLRRLGARLAARLLPAAAPLALRSYGPLPYDRGPVLRSARLIRYCLVERGPPPVRA